MPEEKTPLQSKILELWHISRTALANQNIPISRYDRLLYIKNQLNKDNPELITKFSPKQLWLEISKTTLIINN